MSYADNARKLKVLIDTNQQIVDDINEIGGYKVTIEPSDKLGFDWECYYVNNILVYKKYVEQEESTGTADNPIPWNPELALYPNYYYIYDGIRKVWTGELGVTGNWDDEKFVEF